MDVLLSIRWGLVVFLAVVVTVAGALGVLPIIWWLVLTAWTVAPVPVTVLYAAAGAGILAMTVYPRTRLGVIWTEIRTGAVPQPADAWTEDVVDYLAAVRDDYGRAA